MTARESLECASGPFRHTVHNIQYTGVAVVQRRRGHQEPFQTEVADELEIAQGRPLAHSLCADAHRGSCRIRASNTTLQSPDCAC